MIKRTKPRLTLKDVIETVSQFARNERETAVAVADLLNRGVVRIIPQPARVAAHRRRF